MLTLDHNAIYLLHLPGLITAPVLQGSILGPLLYTLYTADIPEPIDLVVITFADETTGLSLSEDYNITVKNVQQLLDAILTEVKRGQV